MVNRKGADPVVLRKAQPVDLLVVGQMAVDQMAGQTDWVKVLMMVGPVVQWVALWVAQSEVLRAAQEEVQWVRDSVVTPAAPLRKRLASDRLMKRQPQVQVQDFHHLRIHRVLNQRLQPLDQKRLLPFPSVNSLRPSRHAAGGWPRRFASRWRRALTQPFRVQNLYCNRF